MAPHQASHRSRTARVCISDLHNLQEHEEPAAFRKFYRGDEVLSPAGLLGRDGFTWALTAAWPPIQVVIFGPNSVEMAARSHILAGHNKSTHAGQPKRFDLQVA